MSKKSVFVLIGVIIVIVAAVVFFSMRRSTMMGGGSQVSANGLVAVSAKGEPLPNPAAGTLPANTARQAVGGLVVSLALKPYPPSGGQPNNFDVTLTDANGQAISDAAITLDLTMPAMRMPTNKLNMVAGGAGKYQAAGYYTMRGLWRIEVIITQGGKKQSAFFEVGL